MATQVYTEEDIVLQDGTEVTLRPLPIAILRDFMEAWEAFGEAKDDNEGFNVFINCSGLALQKNFRDKYDIKADKADRDKGEWLNEKYKEYLEDVLELPTIYKILDVCGGIKLSDPKLLEEALAQIQEDGQSST